MSNLKEQIDSMTDEQTLQFHPDLIDALVEKQEKGIISEKKLRGLLVEMVEMFQDGAD